MTPIFSPQRRDEVLENLRTFLQADEQVAGVVLLGPLAQGRQDLFGGLALQIVVKNGAVFPSLYRKWKQRLQALFPAAYLFEENVTEHSARLHLMLSDYLELDLHLVRLAHLRARRKPWKVLFDQTLANELEGKLNATYQPSPHDRPTRLYQETMSTVWRPIVRCVAAVKRGDVWQAIYMLDTLRHLTIQIAAVNHDLEAAEFAEVDQLPEMLLIRLRHTVPTSLSQTALRRALRTTVLLLFSEAEQLEQKLGVELASEVQRRMRPFVEAFS